jgi:hypothetical protein
MPAVGTTLPAFDSVMEQVAAAERAEGWLSACEDAGRFLVPCRELVVSLAHWLGSLGKGPVLEVCAGRGELAESLRAAGVRVVATDVEAAEESTGGVERMAAEEALRRYRPRVVLGSFVPVDAGIDRLVMEFPSVRHYVVLGARLGGLLGSALLWQAAGWTARPLDAVARWMITRHDVWIDRQTILRHGEAWLFSKDDRSAMDQRQGSASV